MAIEVTVPQLGESIVEATVGRWLRSQGEVVEEGTPLVELETDKVNVEVPAPATGALVSVAKEEGDTVTIGEALAQIDTSQQAASAPPAEEPSAQPETAPPAAAAAQPDGTAAPVGGAPPSVRRFAAEQGVDIAAVAGSGPHGRVTRDDVAAQARPAQPPAPTAAPPAPAQSVAAARSDEPAGPRREERVRMSRRRQTIATRLLEVRQNTAMLTTFNEVDLSEVMRLRRERKDRFKELHGVGLGFMSFFTRAVVGALKAYPRLNAEIQGNEMVLKRYYDIGIAVSTDDGLVVPVVRDADRLNFAEIEQAIADLAKKARAGALTLEDLRGGTFTITNGGIFGSLMSTPILNAPQVGILGMHGIQERPIVRDGKVVVRPMMYLALSYDHRIVDGSESVRFLVHIKEMLEDPVKLLLEG